MEDSLDQLLNNICLPLSCGMSGLLYKKIYWSKLFENFYSFIAKAAYFYQLLVNISLPLPSHTLFFLRMVIRLY
jgi:hypothetical protein